MAKLPNYDLFMIFKGLPKTLMSRVIIRVVHAVSGRYSEIVRSLGTAHCD